MQVAGAGESKLAQRATQCRKHLCRRKQLSTTSNRQNTLRMPRVTTPKQLSTTRADNTKKRRTMHIPLGVEPQEVVPVQTEPADWCL